MIIIGLLSFWILTYLFNLSLYPFGGDSSEVATSMVTWGLSHPPGYPFQNLIGNIFIRIIPFFNIYQKTAFISAICTLLTSIVIINILFLFIRRRQFILLSAILFLTLFPVWLYGIVPEVFSLALLIISLQIFFLLKFYLTKNYKYFYLFLLFIGLGAAHHHIFVLFIPGYLYILFKKIKVKLNLSLISKSLLFCLIGFLPYLYAPIVSFQNTPMDMENAKTIDGFLRLLLRSSYGTFTAFPGASPNIINQLLNMLSIFIFIIKDFKPLGLIIISFGLIYLFRKIRYLFIFFVINIMCLLYFYFITNFNLSGSFSMGTFERFFVFLYLLLVIIFSFGCLYIYEILLNNIKKITNKKLIKVIAVISFYFLIIIYIAISLLNNYAVIKTIVKNKIFQNYSFNILNSLPKNSYLFLNSDHGIFLVKAAQLIDKKRVDVVTVPSLISRDYVKKKFKEENPNIIIPSNEMLSKIPEINYPKKNYFYSDKPISKGVWAPTGLIWRYFPTEEEYKKYKNEIISFNIRLWLNSYSLEPLSRDEKSIFFFDQIYENYANQLAYAIHFFIIENHAMEAEKIAGKYYQSLKHKYNFKLAYIYLHTVLNLCTDKDDQIFSTLINGDIANLNDYKYLIKYADLCKKNDSRSIKLLEDGIKKLQSVKSKK